MERGLYIAAAGMVAEMVRQDQISNDLANAAMTVDVTPRRCQRFKTPAGSEVSWSTSTGAPGKVIVNSDGIVTIPRVQLRPDSETLLMISR